MRETVAAEPDVTERPWGAVARALRGRRWQVVRIVASGLLAGLLEAGFLVLVTRAALAITAGRHRVLLHATWSTSVGWALFAAAILAVGRIAAGVWGAWDAARASASAVAAARQRAAAAYLRADWPTQQALRSGGLQDLVLGLTTRMSMLMSGVNQGLTALASLVALLAVAIVVDPVGAAVLIGAVAILGSVLRPLRRRVGRRSRAELDSTLGLSATVSNLSDLGPDLVVFDVQEAAFERVGDGVERVRSTSASTMVTAGVVAALYMGLAYVAVVGALAAASHSSSAALASFGASMLVMLRSLSYGQAMQAAQVSLAGAAPALAEYERQVAFFEAGHRGVAGVPAPNGPSEVMLREVTYSYGASPPAVEGATFRIARGEMVGIIGPSGSGKSTLVQLLLGLRQPQSGVVLVDGVDLATIDRAAWARRATFVGQSPRLLDGSIADNVRFMRPWVTDERLRRAAQMAHLHDEIEAMDEGYETMLGNGGRLLSGGQMQRLCIARALAEDPGLMILDEPTSSLDPMSERLIRDLLGQLKQSMALVVIAHRLTTLETCDRLMVLQDGRVTASGTPASLAATDEFYRRSLELSRLGVSPVPPP